MKIRILAIIAVLLFIVTVNTAAAEKTFDINVFGDYLYVYRGDNVDEIADIIGVGKAELLNEFNKGGLLYFAVSPDNSVRIRLSEYADNFSVKAVDFSYINDENKQSFLRSLGDNATLVKSGGREYAVISEVLSGDSDAYTVTQYITVCGGKTYYLSCYNEGEGTSGAVEEIFSSLSLYGENTTDKKVDRTLAAIVIGIVAFAAMAVIMVIGLYRTIKFKEN